MIGVFLIILAALIAFGFVFPGLFSELYFYLGIVFAAVLFIVFYFVYKWWLGRK